MKQLASSLLVFLMLCLPATAANDPAKLARDAIATLEQAHLALNAASRAGDRVAALSLTIRAFEEGLDALRESLRRAALREAAIKAEFDAESEQVSDLLAVLVSIQSSNGPLSLLHPSGPLGTVRSGLIVSDITPAIQAKVDKLRTRLEEVALLRALQESAVNTLQQGLSGVQTARTNLSQAISSRTELPQLFVSDPERLQSLIDSAETLEGFASGLVGLDTGNAVADPGRDFLDARGNLELPVSGTVLRGFDEPDAAGIRRPGLLVATRPLSLVSAPWPSTLRYRGPLLDYGNVMILEPDAGVLMVLAGLDQVYGEVGQVLPPDTALGLMGGDSVDPERFFQNAVNGAGSEQTETLYIELRMGTKPVDPAPWFIQTKE